MAKGPTSTVPGRWLDPETREGLWTGRAVVAGVAAWCVARAALVGITHDEALTLLIHVPGSWGDVFAHRLYIGSNNHLLNTVLLKLLLGILPPHEWAIRVPALAGLAMYLAGCWRLLRRLVSGPRFAFGLALLATNPFLVDLHTLARGYGLGLGLLALGASCALGRERGPSVGGHAIRNGCVVALAALAVASNLSLAYGATGLGVLAVGATLRRARHGDAPWRVGAAGVIPWALAAGASALVYRPGVLASIGFYVAEWGGTRGFWADTVGSLAAASLYRPELQRAAPGLTAAVAAVVAVGSGLALWRLWRGREWTPLASCVAYFWLVASAMAAVKLAFGLRWPLDRSAVVLVPACGLVLLCTWELLARRGSKVASAGSSAAWVIVLVLVAISLVSWNLSRTYLWPMDAPARPLVRSIAASTAGNAKGTVRMAASWELEPAVNFYRMSRQVEALAPLTRPRLEAGFDLYYLAARDRPVVKTLGLSVCREFPDAGTLLAVPVGVRCPAF